jgi:hypothetical protein
MEGEWCIGGDGARTAVPTSNPLLVLATLSILRSEVQYAEELASVLEAARPAECWDAPRATSHPYNTKYSPTRTYA